MKRVKFIRELVIDEVPMVERDEIRYHVFDDLVPFSADAALIAKDVEVRVVPVHRLSKMHNGETVTNYIAYSKEVQELLEMPFDVMKKEREILDGHCTRITRELDSYRDAKLWARIKFVFQKQNSPRDGG